MMAQRKTRILWRFRGMVVLVFAPTCLLAGCTQTYRRSGASAPPLAVHPVVTKPAPVARKLTPVNLPFVRGEFRIVDVLYYFPDRQLTGVRVESVTVKPTRATN